METVDSVLGSIPFPYNIIGLVVLVLVSLLAMRRLTRRIRPRSHAMRDLNRETYVRLRYQGNAHLDNWEAMRARDRKPPTSE